MKNLPIGFIDSGVGGLTVVKQSLRQLPNESIIYLGDNARCPYGPRPLEEVKKYIWQLTNFLREKGIRYSFVKVLNGITTYKYKKTEELFKALTEFYKGK